MTSNSNSSAITSPTASFAPEKPLSQAMPEHSTMHNAPATLPTPPNTPARGRKRAFADSSETTTENDAAPRPEKQLKLVSAGAFVRFLDPKTGRPDPAAIMDASKDAPCECEDKKAQGALHRPHQEHLFDCALYEFKGDFTIGKILFTKKTAHGECTECGKGLSASEQHRKAPHKEVCSVTESQEARIEGSKATIDQNLEAKYRGRKAPWWTRDTSSREGAPIFETWEVQKTAVPPALKQGLGIYYNAGGVPVLTDCLKVTKEGQVMFPQWLIF